MIGSRLAVIDLGSNTFHLLICELTPDHSLRQVYKERVYVKLALGGLDFIPEESQTRGLRAMERFAHQLHVHQVDQVRAIGTSALREAKNGKEVAKQYTEATGIPIEIIDGYEEARYILQGTRAALPPLDQYGLIMDIGGGSVEFILFKGNDISFKESYKIGVSVLHLLFHRSDPIASNELSALESFLEEQLSGLVDAVKKLPVYYLIGSSGSFEVIQDAMARIDDGAYWSRLDIDALPPYLDRIIGSDLEERKKNPEIPEERIDYIVVAYALIRYLIRQCPPARLYYCDFALKEGVLAEMANISNLD